jgi:hypothetical protein
MSSGEGSRKPSFSGNRLPANINPIGVNDIGEETTRRVAYQPCFESVSSFQPAFVTVKPHVSQAKSCGLTSDAVDGCSSTVSRGIWKLRIAPTLPEHYPLERTAVFVPNASPSEVSLRVSNVLRECSIEADYEDDKAKAKCFSADGVDFRVRLYRGRREFDHGIIVEVQRRFGFSSTYYSDVVAILDAAEGKVSKGTTPSGWDLPLCDECDEPIEGSSSLSMVSHLLRHQGYDAHYLALQTLSSLTNSSKIGGSTARAVSAELFRADAEHDVLDKVLSLLIGDMNADDAFNLRSMSLLVIANAFESLNGDVQSIIKDQLRPTLLFELRRADSNPSNAAQAARILEFYLPEDSGRDVRNALNFALQEGCARYASLEQQARVCLAKLA